MRVGDSHLAPSLVGGLELAAKANPREGGSRRIQMLADHKNDLIPKSI